MLTPKNYDAVYRGLNQAVNAMRAFTAQPHDAEDAKIYKQLLSLLVRVTKQGKREHREFKKRMLALEAAKIVKAAAMPRRRTKRIKGGHCCFPNCSCGAFVPGGPGGNCASCPHPGSEHYC